MIPIVHIDKVPLVEANILLRDWNHKMGPFARGNQQGICHVLFHEYKAEAVTIASTLIRENVGGVDGLTRENTIELSRLCASRPALCRVMLRLWREFIFPGLGYDFAISYQDADLHTGNTYRFDGWQRVGYSHSGTDTRSGRPGRDKWVWQWPPNPQSLDTRRAPG
jgi:hypothetical protein